jgi:uncharacterized protein YcbX
MAEVTVPRIEAIYYAPVKALALAPLERARLEKAGIPGDRAFFIVGGDGKMVTQREHFPLTQVHAAFDVDRDRLELRFPGGETVADGVREGEAIATHVWGRPVEARVVDGPFNDALSSFAGQPLRIVRPAPGQAFDGYPISMCSHESLAALASAAGRERDDGRRFRQNIIISGAPGPHGEDTWIGGEVRIGTALARVKRKDSRCVITTRNPDTGEHDMNTLKIIATYRKDDDDDHGDVNFGVYCTIVEPGEAAIGDEVRVV